MNEFLQSPSFRRLLVTMLTPALILMKDKLGIEVSQESIDALIGLAISYVLGSNLNDMVTKRAVDAGKVAADKVISLEDARAVLAAAAAAEKAVVPE